MDPATVHFYSRNAKAMAERYAAIGCSAARVFPQAFTPGSRVLDIGCGSGRDLQALVESGYNGLGIDASAEMLRVAQELHPAIADLFSMDSLPNLATIADASQDGVMCWAVLMHVPEESLFDVVFNLRRILKSGGRLLISTPFDGPKLDKSTGRDPDGRLFNQVTPENFHFLLAKVGFRLLNRWDEEDSLGRRDRRWATQLFVLEGSGSRSLETIEAILNRDKKDATYKPALFRALAELAMTDYHTAQWRPDGRVAIPLEAIAAKWLDYFWPLFESETFVPQKRGEKRDCLKPVAFRSELEDLIRFYRPTGGLSGFSADYRSHRLAPTAARIHRRVLSKLGDTIRNGPIYYAGGGGSGTFTYERHSKLILLQADLWRELSSMGAWILDATILRWAELTAEISQGRLKPSQVIDQLLTAPIPERDVDVARRVYGVLPDKVCVWTDTHLDKRFDVDHALPFAFWRNNDLWNLFPASPSVNNQKRDQLPTRALFRRRKECIIHYWSHMREEHEERFAFEIGKLIGSAKALKSDWEIPLFNAVAEALEVTAIQRAIERWEPGVRLARSHSASSPKAIARNACLPNFPSVPDLIVYDPPANKRFVDCVPFYDVEAAAGSFGPEQNAVDPNDQHAWIRLENLRLTPDLFAIVVRGKSMEPKIPNGSYCLFRSGDALAGSRQGRIVLVALCDGADPETGGRLTVKRYSSEKVWDETGSFRHTRILLEPLNRDFPSILIETADEDTLRVLGEFVQVVAPANSTCS